MTAGTGRRLRSINHEGTRPSDPLPARTHVRAREFLSASTENAQAAMQCAASFTRSRCFCGSVPGVLPGMHACAPRVRAAPGMPSRHCPGPLSLGSTPTQ